jgi:hypothetical protein
MRKRTRLATTAGVTVLGFAAMSGMAQADTGGLGLPVDLTGSLAKTGPVGTAVDGVVKQTTGAVKTTSATRSSGVRLNLPAHVALGAPGKSGGSAPAVHAGVKASVGTSPLSARVGVRVCARPLQQCRRVPSPPSPIPPSPPSPIPPAPPTPPPVPPVGNPLPPQPPGVAPAAGSVTVIGDSLPFTGGPIGALTLLGATAVVAGAGGVAASRRKPNRSV